MPKAKPIPGAPAHIPTMRSRSGPTKRRIPPQTYDRNYRDESQLFDDASIMSSPYQQADFQVPSGAFLDEGELNRRTALRDIIEEQQYMRGGADEGPSFTFSDGTTIDFRQALRAPYHL